MSATKSNITARDMHDVRKVWEGNGAGRGLDTDDQDLDKQ
jgi:hypothetical protein